jgi:hypothetical protein
VRNEPTLGDLPGLFISLPLFVVNPLQWHRLYLQTAYPSEEEAVELVENLAALLEEPAQPDG